MKRITRQMVLIAVCLSFALAAVKASEGPKPVTNKKCPMTQGEVSEQIRTEYKDQYVYFCCDGCVESFKSNPEAAISKLSKEDQEAIKANTKCPITDEPVNKSFSIESKGRKVYFCCGGCSEKFKEKEQKDKE